MIRRRSYFLLLFLFLLLGSVPQTDAGDPSSYRPAYADSLIHQAQALQLSQDPYWRILLHYRGRWFGKIRSEIQAHDFFSAPDGRTQPEAELEATLLRFFEPAPRDPNLQHPQCLYIDRYRWLKSKLRFDPAELPEQKCANYEEWRKALDPGSATLVFLLIT